MPESPGLGPDDFDYDLPDAAIAQQPVEPRDAARLLVDRGDAVDHRTVADLAELVGPGDVVVLNDTRVLPARLQCTKPTGGRVEVLLLEAGDDQWWECLVRPSRRVAPGTVVSVGDALRAEVGEDLGRGRRRVRFDTGGAELLDVLARVGEMPLPPYLRTRLGDPERYQTVYARRPASAAAPTAGLHLTPAVLAAMADRGAEVATVELVVGLDTFRPMEVDRLEDHHMHTEAYRVPPATAEAVERADRVIAVGTTTVRALESAAATGDPVGRTDLFIRRPFPWQVVDVLMTNFHLPRSTLLVMIDAFVGPRWRDLYAEALATGYRFLSFGDAMWLERSA